MGDYQQKPNEGGLFRDEKKKNNDDRDYNGSALVRCVKCGHEAEHWLSGYLKISARTGKKWMKLLLQPKDAPADTPQEPTHETPDDDIPF